MVIEWNPLIISMQLATITTVCLLVIGVPFSAWIAHHRGVFGVLLRACIMLPLVLPPTVLGFYFLLAWNPHAPCGVLLENLFGVRFVFTFEGLVAASVIAGMPFMFSPLIAGFEALPRSLVEAAAVLGKSPLQTLWHVLLPAVRPALVSGAVMTFIHTYGEFGLVLMLGGKIPGKTMTASMALYDYVENLQFTEAHLYALLLMICSFGALIALFATNRAGSRGV